MNKLMKTWRKSTVELSSIITLHDPRWTVRYNPMHECMGHLYNFFLKKMKEAWHLTEVVSRVKNLTVPIVWFILHIDKIDLDTFKGMLDVDWLKRVSLIHSLAFKALDAMGVKPSDFISSYSLSSAIDVSPHAVSICMKLFTRSLCNYIKNLMRNHNTTRSFIRRMSFLI
jgi:hypothetical protein